MTPSFLAKYKLKTSWVNQKEAICVGPLLVCLTPLIMLCFRLPMSHFYDLTLLNGLPKVDFFSNNPPLVTPSFLAKGSRNSSESVSSMRL